MRVIAGSARRLLLETPPGLDVRPTTDRIKETLFNIINNSLYDAEFLDLFSGSGAIGIEALSRGALSAVFVDNSRISVDYINKNLEHTGLREKAKVINSDCVSAISKLYYEKRQFDIIFMDPPYGKLLEKNVLEEIKKYNILKPDGFIIVEALSDTDFSYAPELSFKITREKLYGSNKHVFLEA